MVNPLLLLPLLNTSRTLQDGKCFGEPTSGTPGVCRPTYDNCVTAINYIPQFDKSHAPISFAREADKGYEVPKYWVFRDCAVKLDVQNEDDVDEATFFNIKKTARGVTELCVRFRYPHMGGITDVGLLGSLHISVFGFHVAASKSSD